MVRARFHFDWVLLSAAALLSGVSLLLLYSLSAGSAGVNFFERQAWFVGVGFLIIFGVGMLDYRFIGRSSTPLYFLSLGVLLITLFLGEAIRGTAGWLSLGFIAVQPVEFAKVVLILFLASFIRKKRTELGEWTRILASFVLSAIMIVLVLKQPDLGSSLVLSAIWLGMLVVAGIRLRHVAVLFVIGSLFVGLSWFLLAPYQKDRINTFLHPELDPRGSGYNVLQAMVAVGSGGWFGKGLGHGSQSQLNFLPERHTDFLYAVIAEELGVVGAWFVLILYGVLLYRIKRIADLSQDNFGYLIGVGVMILFFAHITVNIGMNMGILPVTGLPAPLLSYGGSSFLATCVALGLLQSVYRARREEGGVSLPLEKNFLAETKPGLR